LNSRQKRGPGRPPKTPFDLPLPKPMFYPFLCEWKNCPAELHNLETLRNHLFNVHSRKLTSGSYVCLWADCGAKGNIVDEKTQTQRIAAINFKFKTKKELHSHIEQAHLIPFAWHMGDGSKATSLAARENSDLRSTSPWLFDANGNQVTPSVENIPIESGHPRHNNARRFVKKLEGIHVVLIPVAEKNPAPVAERNQPDLGESSVRKGTGIQVVLDKR